jgi:hypothetical protein
MRTYLLLPLLLLAVTAASQPGFDRNYCGFAPNDSIDITNDGIPDLVVLGFRIGTDDEPSSSGSCYLNVANLPGTTILNVRDANGYWRTKVCAEGEQINAMPTRPQDDLHIPLVTYTDGYVRVAYWGYGHQSSVVTITPNLEAQNYVFRTVANGRTWHGSFTIEPPVSMGQVKVRVGALVPVDQPFVIR